MQKMFSPAEVDGLRYALALGPATSVREVMALAAAHGGPAAVLADLEAAGPGWDEGPSCSICDALGHGYPGGAPCPLEDSAPYDPIEEALMAMDPQTNGTWAR